MEAAGTDLHRAVAAHQLVVEVDAHLGHCRQWTMDILGRYQSYEDTPYLRNGVVGSEDEGVDDVVPAVAAGLETGNLGAGDHHGLACRGGWV